MGRSLSRARSPNSHLQTSAMDGNKSESNDDLNDGKTREQNSTLAIRRLNQKTERKCRGQRKARTINLRDKDEISPGSRVEGCRNCHLSPSDRIQLPKAKELKMSRRKEKIENAEARPLIID